jgi:hydroxyethylthiazole kinase
MFIFAAYLSLFLLAKRGLNMTPKDLLIALRTQNPLVQCITNYVAMKVAANVVLAAGASPAMVHASEEVADFTPIGGVLTILRGNASEILALAGEAGAGKGVDSGDSVDAAQGAAKALATQCGTVVAITGPVDHLTDGDRTAHVSGGSSLMPQVTALGCSQTALIGAYAASGPAFDAALAALAHFKVAGTAAAKLANVLGSFQMHFLDALAATQPGDLAQAIV